MNIISYNINGVRAAIKKGLIDWLKEEDPDIICFQEVKAEQDQVPLEEFAQLGYSVVGWNSAQKKGYSGVATLAKKSFFTETIYGMGIEKYDKEGRLLLHKNSHFCLINSYFPSGTSGDERQSFKYEWLDDFFAYIINLKSEYPNLIICGDFNICHKEIDIHNPGRNKNTSGFLPAEREWMTRFFDCGFADSFRVFNQVPDQYTWWSYRANSRAKNLGWRIDYFAVTENFVANVQKVDILSDVKHSDHCPVKLVLDFN